jgi:DNA invertase Pin-like site-specific DNA recombinase
VKTGEKSKTIAYLRVSTLEQDLEKDKSSILAPPMRRFKSCVKMIV